MILETSAYAEVSFHLSEFLINYGHKIEDITG